MREKLIALGWTDKGDILVRYSDPRIGWKPDGTLIVGYFEYPEKITDIDQLLKIIDT